MRACRKGLVAVCAAGPSNNLNSKSVAAVRFFAHQSDRIVTVPEKLDFHDDRMRIAISAHNLVRSVASSRFGLRIAVGFASRKTLLPQPKKTTNVGGYATPAMGYANAIVVGATVNARHANPR